MPLLPVPMAPPLDFDWITRTRVVTPSCRLYREERKDSPESIICAAEHNHPTPEVFVQDPPPSYNKAVQEKEETPVFVVDFDSILRADPNEDPDSTTSCMEVHH